MADEKDVKEVVEKKNDRTPKKEEKGIFSRIWRRLIRLKGDNIEKRLQYIHKEEAAILARMKIRSKKWKKTARNIIVFSVILEVVAVAYAIMRTRSVKLDPRMRAFRVLPMFLLPALSWALYYGLKSLDGARDRCDQSTLESLRAERQAKIDELKDRTNYYNTQQLIQRYDPDPAAKAAAASVLASKLGAESGLPVFVDEPHLNQHGLGKSSDVELVQSKGLRRRAPSEPRSPVSNNVEKDDENSLPSELGVENQNTVSLGPEDGGWMARLAALLVGEDPTQSYAVICGSCYMHNGLARKEDFLVITYYCPHCHALNKPKNMDETCTAGSSPNMRSVLTHQHAMNKDENPNSPTKPSENSLNKSPDMQSSKPEMDNVNLIKENKKPVDENESANTSVLVANDPTNH